ncbi:MAG: prepilin-type N-terminal cleavage/methylation domain-containing protein [Desulfobacteraceae bacterium]|nr:prepilin-type N-terminal cleavage/methylation domain-containing protein [Desulfobacteraceae bacterium]
MKTKTLTVGTSSSGFTLLELIVVMALLGMMLLFTMPSFHNVLGEDQTKKIALWITVQTKTLKENAYRGQKLYSLHVSLDNGTLWVTDESMNEELLEAAANQGFTLPDDYAIVDIEYPVKGKISSGETEICFYKGGYSDKVFIHVQDNDNNQMSFLIEPFLPKVKIYDDYVGFES